MQQSYDELSAQKSSFFGRFSHQQMNRGLLFQKDHLIQLCRIEKKPIAKQVCFTKIISGVDLSVVLVSFTSAPSIR